MTLPTKTDTPWPALYPAVSRVGVVMATRGSRNRYRVGAKGVTSIRVPGAEARTFYVASAHEFRIGASKAHKRGGKVSLYELLTRTRYQHYFSVRSNTLYFQGKAVTGLNQQPAPSLLLSGDSRFGRGLLILVNSSGELTAIHDRTMTRTYGRNWQQRVTVGADGNIMWSAGGNRYGSDPVAIMQGAGFDIMYYLGFGGSL